MANGLSAAQRTFTTRKVNWAKSRPGPRSKPGQMNKTEAKYAQEVLYPMLLAGEILDYRFEPMKLRLAKNTFYTPDFIVIYKDRIAFHEVKGYARDDWRVKHKVCMELYPWFEFIVVKYQKKEWIYETS